MFLRYSLIIVGVSIVFLVIAYLTKNQMLAGDFMYSGETSNKKNTANSMNHFEMTSDEQLLTKYNYAMNASKEVEIIMSSLEQAYGCRQLVDSSYQPLGPDSYELAKNVLGQIEDPIILRELLHYAEYRLKAWCRLHKDNYCPTDREGDLAVDLEKGIPAQLAHLGTDESMKVLVGLLDEFWWDAGGRFDIGGAITSCGKRILPYLEDYVSKPNSRYHEFAKKLIEFINQGKVFGP